uniref:Secreted protein n=1 Tax=Ascaris lumbricoides TaxID=6252 RepID=A0A0M3IJG4_ASCLU
MVPLLTFMLMFLTRVELDVYASLSVSLLHWQPCIHPILTLWFVKPFHQKIASKLLNGRTNTVIPINFMSQANPDAAMATKDTCKGL